MECRSRAIPLDRRSLGDDRRRVICSPIRAGPTAFTATATAPLGLNPSFITFGRNDARPAIYRGGTTTQRTRRNR